jgi:hypothetical protein
MEAKDESLVDIIGKSERRFQILAPKLEFFNLSDLSVVDLEDLQGLFTEPQLKLLCKILYSKVLLPKRKELVASSQPQPRFFNLQSADKELALCDKVISCSLPDWKQDGKLNIVNLDQHFTLEKDQCSVSKFRIEVIDLSRNCLVSADMKYVSDFVLDYVATLVEVPTFLVRLRYNRIGFSMKDSDKLSLQTAREQVTRLLTLNQRVDIVGNPFSTYDNKSFFQELNVKLLSKIIWIQAGWVTSKSWHGIFENLEDAELRIDIVTRTHLEFYGLSENQFKHYN